MSEAFICDAIRTPIGRFGGALVQGLLDGVELKQTAYALDRGSRQAAQTRFRQEAAGGNNGLAGDEVGLAA